MGLMVKDLFPLYFERTANGFSIEKINGITINELYLSELLTKNILIHVLNSLVRIQETDDSNDKVNSNIYANYTYKLIKRYSEFDYSMFTNIDDENNVYRKNNNTWRPSIYKYNY